MSDPADFEDSSDDEDKFDNKMFILPASTPKKTHYVLLATRSCGFSPSSSLKNESLECTQSSTNKKENVSLFGDHMFLLLLP